MKWRIFLCSSALAVLQLFSATANAAPVALTLEYADKSGTTDAHATGYILFSDTSYLLNGRDRHSYWDTYYNEEYSQSGMTFDQWYGQDTGIIAASITVDTSLTNAGSGTFSYTAPSNSSADTLKDFYWKFTNSSTVDLSENLLNQMNHFMWMPEVGRFVSGSPSMLNEEPHSNDLGDFNYNGYFSLNTNNFGCGNSTSCWDYEMYGNTYPYGKPISLKLDLVSATVNMNPVPLPASAWLFSAGLSALLVRLRRKK